MLLRTLLSSAIGTWFLLRCAVAHADPAAAEALFREGRALLERGDVAAACDKLEASNGLDPSAGTLLNLASCRLQQGRTATAWAQFVSAERLAQNQRRLNQAAEAQRRASELEPRLSTLTLRAPAAPPGLEVRRGGQVVLAGSFGTAVPVDPGQVVIDASAPGYQPLRLELTIGESADRQVLELPQLQKLAAAERAPSEPPRADTQDAAGSRTPDHTVPWVVGGIGGAALVAGGVLGALALSANSSAVEACNQGREVACTETQQRRDHQALASTISVGVGVVGVGVAAIWLLTGRTERPASAWSYQGQITRQSALLRVRVGF